jgi:nicotinamide-nucleotide adenylyltransferase
MHSCARGLTARLLLTTAGASVGRRLSHTRMEGVERLQHHLDSVDSSAEPRVELTCGTVNGLSSVAVMDSSFNPPTRAHLHMLEASRRKLGLKSTLLLLSKQNADKPVVGASLVQRLEMMELIAAASPPESMLCGVTAHPLFVDKATALKQLFGEGARIAVLLGYDTWIRLIDPKYYAPGKLDDALRQIFLNLEVVVASRDAASATSLEPLTANEQEAAVRQLPERCVASARFRVSLHYQKHTHQLSPPYSHRAASHWAVYIFCTTSLNKRLSRLVLCAWRYAREARQLRAPCCRRFCTSTSRERVCTVGRRKIYECTQAQKGDRGDCRWVVLVYLTHHDHSAFDTRDACSSMLIKFQHEFDTIRNALGAIFRTQA